jgi:hypothetical protein
MTEFDYADAPVTIRDDLRAAHARAWRHVSSPGTWLTGDERIAVAREVRHAPHCRLCKARAESLSPYSLDGEHDACTALDANRVEVIHRVRTDQSRLTDRWFESVLGSGVFVTEYVEMVGVLASVMAVDGFCDAMGLDRRELPSPRPGEPNQTRPVGAKISIARVPTVAPEDVSDGEPDLYDGLSGAHIHRALSLVPAEVWAFFDLDAVMYLPDAKLRDFSTEYRAINHAQMELLAARVSALNRCYY